MEGITEYQYQNGLRLLLYPDNSQSKVTVNLTVLVGSRHEGYGETGMAHLLEHLVFKGTPRHPNIPQEMTARGARPNGTTSTDRTNYYQTFDATEDNLRWALDLESDRMINSCIARKDLESEFTVVRNEFESGENNPGSVQYKRMLHAVFHWHNFANGTIGEKSDIEGAPIERLQAFYKTYYQPDNAVLVVTGKMMDNVMVTQVTLTILDPEGRPLEQWDAELVRGVHWEYSPANRGRIRVEARDLPGNVTRGEFCPPPGEPHFWELSARNS